MSRRLLYIIIPAALVVVLTVAAVAWVMSSPPAPRESGYTKVTLHAFGATGGPDLATLNRTREILAERLTASGLTDVRVTIESNQTLVATVAGDHIDEVQRLATPSVLRMRKVLLELPDIDDAPASMGYAPNPPADTTVPVEEQQRRVIAKLGDAYTYAEKNLLYLQQLGDQAIQALAPFSRLTSAEVAVLPTQLQFSVPTVTCRQLDSRPAHAIDDPQAEVVACATSGGTKVKYLLDAARIVGSDLRSANAQYERDMGSWVVNVGFTASGQDKFAAFTKELSASGQQLKLGIVLDNVVLSAPVVMSEIRRDAQIAGVFSQTDAVTLAAQLRSGQLPVTLVVESAEHGS